MVQWKFHKVSGARRQWQVRRSKGFQSRKRLQQRDHWLDELAANRMA